jgi:hypothetical protein
MDCKMIAKAFERGSIQHDRRSRDVKLESDVVSYTDLHDPKAVPDALQILKIDKRSEGKKKQLTNLVPRIAREAWRQQARIS